MSLFQHFNQLQTTLNESLENGTELSPNDARVDQILTTTFNAIRKEKESREERQVHHHLSFPSIRAAVKWLKDNTQGDDEKGFITFPNYSMASIDKTSAIDRTYAAYDYDKTPTTQPQSVEIVFSTTTREALHLGDDIFVGNDRNVMLNKGVKYAATIVDQDYNPKKDSSTFTMIPARDPNNHSAQKKVLFFQLREV